MGQKQLLDGWIGVVARVTGAGIDPKGTYGATELVGLGLYRLQRIEPPETALGGFTTVKISLAAVKKIGRHKLPGETLAAAIERLALAQIQGSSQNSEFKAR